MAAPYKFSPSQGSKINVKINANFVEIKGAEGIPEYGPETLCNSLWRSPPLRTP